MCTEDEEKHVAPQKAFIKKLSSKVTLRCSRLRTFRHVKLKCNVLKFIANFSNLESRLISQYLCQVL